MTSNRTGTDYLEGLSNNKIGDCGHSNSNRTYVFIKEEKEIVVKTELEDVFEDYLQKQANLSIGDEMYERNEAFQLHADTTDEQMSINAPLERIHDDSSLLYNLTKHKDMIEEEVKHSTNLQHTFTLNDLSAVDNCNVEVQPVHIEILCGAPSQGELHIRQISEYRSTKNTEKELLKYEDCDYSAVQKQDKNKSMLHIGNHTDAKPFKCRKCHYSSVQKIDVVRHIRSHTGEKPFKCEMCPYSASIKYNLVGHIRSHTADKPFKCEICQYSASHKSSLRRHIKTHMAEKPFKCEMCDYSCVTKYHLARHSRSHTEERPFTCQICFYSASHKSNLLRHIRRHTGEKPFQCEMCDYSGVTKLSLVRHIRCHTGEKPYKCEICDYSASQKYNLVMHVRTHTGEKRM